jgi:molybdopterin molybdotransferase
MIGHLEARELVLSAASALAAERLSAREVLGRYLAEPLVSAVDSPAFSNSAVDGYGVRLDDVADAHADQVAELRLAGEVRAGDDPSGLTLQPGTTIRILTGAAVPAGVEAVVMKEDCDLGDEIVRVRHSASEGENIRSQGEEYRAGEVLLEPGTYVSPPVCGLIAATGNAEVSVHRTPIVAIVTTGDELVQPGEALRPGQIYESNSVALSAAIQALGIHTVKVSHAKDEAKATTAALKKALTGSDVVLTTGGVSVGEYDVVKEAFTAAGIEEGFWRVAIKPGMPLFFGTKGSKLVFGLPGNPVSAMVNFYLFVRPGLMRMMGAPEVGLHLFSARLGSDIWKKPGRVELVRGFVREDAGERVAEPIDARGSHMLGGLARAECLIVLPEESGRVLAGAEVEVLPLRWRAW